MELTDDDVRALRADGDLTALLKQHMRAAPARNKDRRTLVARYPDLLEKVLDLPGHAAWTGSVGGRQDVADIVAEAEARAATDDRRRAA
jgi:hypothetical protein